jgi:hypothetical protein
VVFDDDGRRHRPANPDFKACRIRAPPAVLDISPCQHIANGLRIPLAARGLVIPERDSATGILSSAPKIRSGITAYLVLLTVKHTCEHNKLPEAAGVYVLQTRKEQEALCVGRARSLQDRIRGQFKNLSLQAQR